MVGQPVSISKTTPLFKMATFIVCEIYLSKNNAQKPMEFMTGVKLHAFLCSVKDRFTAGES